MRKFLGILLVATTFSLATTASQCNQEQVDGIVIVDSVAALPDYDFTFEEMKLLPLDVFASPMLADDFLIQETCEGYSVTLLKPPISLTVGVAANINYSGYNALEHLQQSSYIYGNFLSWSV